MGCLDQFQLVRSEIEAGGGGKSKIARRFDDFLQQRGWAEKSVKVSRTVGDQTADAETHKVDFSKGRVAVEVEWNNKDPFFSRDLNAFRLLHELDVVSVCVLTPVWTSCKRFLIALAEILEGSMVRQQRTGAN